MDGDVVGLIALDEVLRFFAGGVVRVTFEFQIRDDLFEDDTADASCFRVPGHVIATLECLAHIIP